MNARSVTLLLAALAVVLFADFEQLVWVISRASGFVAVLFLVVSMAVGILSSTRATRPYFHAANLFEAHRTSGYLTLVAIAVHTLGLLADDYIGFSFRSVLVPGVSSYRPVPVGLGIVAAYLTIIVAFSFDLKRSLGHRLWRTVHMLNFPLLVLALAHGIFAGTDTGSAGAQLFYYGSGFVVLAMTLFMVLTPRRRAGIRDRTGH